MKLSLIFSVCIILLPVFAFAKTVDNLSVDGSTTELTDLAAVIINLNSVQAAFNHSSNTDNIKVCHHSNRTICKIRIRERMPAIIKLPRYDKIQSWILGDNQNFSFDVLDQTQQKAVLRGIYPGADTNLSIIGESGFIYVFYIRIDSAASQYLSDFIVYIKLKDKDKKTLREFEITQRKKLQQITKSNVDTKIENSSNKPNKTDLDYLDKKSLIDASQLNFNFQLVGGDKILMPNKIFDDGIWTYFQYGKKDLLKTQDLPVIYKVKDGFDTPVNSRIEGGYLIAETTSKKWTIRAGQVHACVHRVNL